MTSLVNQMTIRTGAAFFYCGFVKFVATVPLNRRIADERHGPRRIHG